MSDSTLQVMLELPEPWVRLCEAVGRPLGLTTRSITR